MPNLPRGAAIALVAAALGCGDDAMAPVDGGPTVDGSVSDAAAAVTPPAEAALPGLTPCATGWREVAMEEGVVGCEPWPETGRASCTEVDEAHFAGEPGCVRVGTDCPASGFPEDLPAGVPVLYVLAGATATPDGSMAAPYPRVRDAIMRASAGAIVAIGRGTYDEALDVRAGVTLRGACVRETVLVMSFASMSDAVVETMGDGVVVSNLRIGASPRLGALAAAAGRTLELSDVVVESTTALAVVAADGGSVSLNGSVVRDTAPAEDGRFGRALEISIGASARLERVVLERNRGDAIFMGGEGATLDATGVVIDDTREALATEEGGRAISTQQGAVATLRDTVVERSREAAVVAIGDGTSVALDGCVVRDTLAQVRTGGAGRGLDSGAGAVITAARTRLERNREAQAFVTRDARIELTDCIVREGVEAEMTGEGGNAVRLRGPATAAVTRTLVARSREYGILVAGAGAVLTGEDVVIVDSEPGGPTAYGGFAIALQEGGSAGIRRLRVERAHVVGIVPDGAGSSLVLEDVVVRDTRADGLGEWGRGLNAQNGSTTEVTRALFDANREYAVQAHGTGTSVVLRDLSVRDTRARDADGLSGIGVVAQDGARIEVERAVVERSPSTAILSTAPGSVIRLVDVTVSDPTGEAPTGFYGRGISSQLGGRIEGSVIRILRSLDIGIFAGGSGATVELDDVQILGVSGRACATTTCMDSPYGIGAGSYDGATLRLDGFTIDDAVLCGVQLARSGAIDLANGAVRGAAIGACVQVDGYDVGRLSDGVLYEDNGTNLDSTTLPVPDAVTPSDGI